MDLRICLFGAGWAFALVFVATPMLAMILDFDHIIYFQGNVSAASVAFNLVCVAPFFVAAAQCSKIRIADTEDLGRGFKRAVVPVSLVIILWAICFLSFGGLVYRDQDVAAGYASRGAVLSIVLTFQSIIVVLCAFLFLALSRVRLFTRLFALAALGSFVLSVAASGSRGVLVQLALTLWATQLLIGGEVRWRSWNALAAMWRLSGYAGKSVGIILLGVLFVFLLGLWGLYRDQQENLVLATIYRAAEPYWHHALIYHQGRDIEWSVLGDALSRIASIPLRWFGVAYEGSIDGAEVLLEKYTGIPFEVGVSLPITLLGHGQLFAGYGGSFLFIAVAIALIVVCIRIFRRLPFDTPALRVAFFAHFFPKCFFLYPKSLSGAFLVLTYEPLRDYLGIALLFFIFRNLFHGGAQNAG